MTSNPEETTIAPADACPTGITFGESTKLTPDGEVVKNAQIAHFNNGDYVALWTEINVPSPRLEFQLFKGSDNTKIITSCSLSDSSPLVQCPGEIVTDITDKKLGRTHIGVYEDYTFLIAWSEQEHTYSPWKIIIKSFKYNIEAGTYTLGEEVKIFEKIQNHGIFGFATLSLDNGFILTYMDDPYHLRTYIYKAKSLGSDDESSNSNPLNTNAKLPEEIKFAENVISSYKKEIIVKSVPTQYFFSVISSSLMDGRGIYIWNYRIDNGNEICGVSDESKPSTIASQCYGYISSNPTEIFADLSYEGLLAVVWQEVDKDIPLQKHPVYKVQMLNVTSLIKMSFIISAIDDGTPVGDMYLLDIYMQSDASLLAIFVNQESQQEETCVKIFGSDGALINTASSSRGADHVFSVMVHPFPESPQCKSWKTKVLYVSPSWDLLTLHSLVNRYNDGWTNERKSLFISYNKLAELVTTQKKAEEFSEDEKVTYFFLVERITPLYTRWILADSQHDPALPNFDSSILFTAESSLIIWDYCTNLDYTYLQSSIYLGGNQHQLITYICPSFYSIQPPNLEPLHIYGTSIGEIARAKVSELNFLNRIQPKRPPNENLWAWCSNIKLGESGFSKIKYPECVGYFLEAAASVLQCKAVPHTVVEVCNSTSPKSFSDVADSIANINNFLYLKQIPTDITKLNINLQNAFKTYIDSNTNNHESTWNITRKILIDIYVKINNIDILNGVSVIYGEMSSSCSISNYALVPGDLVTDGRDVRVGNSIYLCPPFTTLKKLSPDKLSSPVNSMKYINNNDDTPKMCALFHELTHTVGASDYYAGQLTYYESGCARWAKEHPKIELVGEMLADCLMIFFCDAFFLGGWQ